ncbi:MAG: ABC transporter [Pyrobaculum sp.]
MNAKILIATAILITILAAQEVRVPILVDLSHGEFTKGLDFWVNRTANPLAIVDFAQLHILVPPGASPDPVLTRINASRLAVFITGDLSTIDLSRFKVIILGQPSKPLTDAELSALRKWFYSGGKVLWCAADSDYPAQGSEESQIVCNDVAEYLGARLRIDYVSVEDPRYNIGGAGYRVIGVIDPPPQLGYLGFLTNRVMFHGPGAVAVVLPDGRWVPATSPEAAALGNVYVIAKTTPNGIIVEHRTSADGRGRDGRAHKAGDRGEFALMALEFLNGSVLIMSGETPYGGYEPIVASSYRGVELDGHRFLRNILLWATGNYRELSTMVSQIDYIQRLEKSVQDVASRLERLSEELKSTEALYRLGGVENELRALVDSLSKKLDVAIAEANNAKVVAFVGTALALVFAIAATVLAVRKGGGRRE